MIERPWFLFHQPKPVPLESELKNVLTDEFTRTDDRNWEQELQISQHFYSTYLANDSYLQAFQTFLDLCFSINNLHAPFEKQYQPRSVNVMNTAINHLIELLCLDHACEVSVDYLDNLALQASVLEEEPTRQRWFKPKVSNLGIRLRTMRETYAWINALRNKAKGIQRNDIGEVKQSLPALWRSVIEGRHYGIKTCFGPSPFFLDQHQAFFFFDERLSSDEDLVIRSIPEDTFAIIGIGAKPHVEDSITPSIAVEDTFNIRNAYIRVPGLTQIFAINTNGVIYTSPFTKTPVEWAFTKNHAPGAYDLWKGFMYAHLYDLTHSSERVNVLPKVIDTEKEMEEAIKSKRGSKRIDFKRLIVPRIKKEEKEPAAEDMKSSEKGSRRFIDKYFVSWFVRDLPIGYHASQAAVDYAKSHKVDLMEGETIVRSHWRGKEGEAQSTQRPTQITTRSSHTPTVP